MICTFYSYKGGVGRSMALANVADILARRGVRVLMIDFDLEAPGLEQFFHVNVEGVRRRAGLLDLLLAYKQSMSVASGKAAFKNIEGFISSVYERLPGGGRLDLMAAGQRQDPEQLARYALALRSFDWQDFYYNWEGDLFFEWLRRELTTDRYDMVLVDSRTGVTEMGGICGYQLADAIVMLCAPNTQNVQGTAAMLRDFRSASVESLRRGRPLDIVVVPARVEQRDPALLDDFFKRFDEAFTGIVPKALAAAGITPRELMVPYEPLYAFNERVVSDPAHAGDGRRIGAVFETLAEAVALLADPGTRLGQAARRRDAALAEATTPSSPPLADARYDPARRFAGYDVFLDSGAADDAVATQLMEGLLTRNLQVFRDRGDMAPGADWVAVVEEALFHSRALVFCVGAGPLNPWRVAMLEKAVAARVRGQNLTIIPVLVPGAETQTLHATPLAPFHAVDVRHGVDERAIAQIQQTVIGDRPMPVETETRAPYLGTRAFDEQHADLFFGREMTVQAVLTALDGGPGVLIVGPTGSGKTSLVRAGVVPALRSRAPSERWVVATVTASDQPSRALVDALRLLAPDASRQRGGDLSVDRLIVDALGADESRRLLIFIDMAEAVVGPGVDDEERTRFFGLIDAALGGHVGRVKIVFALCSDSRSRFTAAIGAVSHWSGTTVELGPASVDELRQMVQGPAERVGLAFEPGLVDRILADLQRGSGNLALGEELISALWERRRAGWLTNDAYAALGGVQGVVMKRADALWNELADAEQQVMRSIMLRLVRVGASGGTRQRVFRRALAPGPGADAARLEAHERVLNLLLDRSLVVAIEDNGEAAIEAAHEGLVRAWPRLQGWIEQEREFLDWRERLDTAVSSWRLEHESRDLLLRGPALTEAERRLQERAADLNEAESLYVRASLEARAAREKQRQVVLGAAMGIVFLALVAGGGAYVGWRAAARNLQAAERSTELALSQARASQEQAAQTQKTLAELTQNLEAVQKAAREATEQAVVATAERQRAQTAARELSAKLVELQAQAAAKSRASGEQIREIEQIQRTLKK